MYENISKITSDNISRNIEFKRIFIKNEPYAFEVECSELDGNNSSKEIVYSTHDRSSMNEYKFDKISILKKTRFIFLKKWKEEILKEDSTNPNDIELADIDNDGDLDIVVISDNGNNKYKSTNGSNIIWFENQIQN